MSHLFFLAVSIFSLSDRALFWDPERIAPQTQYAEVYENGVTRFLSEDQVNSFWDSLENSKVLLLIHGFDSVQAYVNYQNILVNVENLQLEQPYDHIIGYFWPSFDDFYEYRKAKKQIDQVKGSFAKILQKMKGKGVQLDVIAHSMGNRLLLESLQTISLDDHFVKNFFAWAPAIDNESLEEQQQYASAAKKCEHVFVFFSRQDEVLQWAYPVPEGDQALGLNGAEHPEKLLQHVQLIDCSDFVEDHSGYMVSPQIYLVLQTHLTQTETL